jgi:hypothetical protein
MEQGTVEACLRSMAKEQLVKAKFRHSKGSKGHG